MNSLPFAKENLYFQSVAGKLYHHPDGFVRLAWSSERFSLEAMKAFYEQVLALLITSNTRKILSEHGNRAPLPAQAQEWLTQNWIPRAMAQARTRHCAIVEGENPLHRLSTQSVVVGAPTSFVFQRFSTLQAAQKWLVGVAV
ncbi:hypothetical protein I2I05_10745 [Hymenobacter sp. BT683]|uniref:STAS/SEC14 domain-containing protein n=1 Tax=Hymenobacter jeongseonensis TaxID=2791027 RepID=A0ABS0IHN4_9BACT|nr:hypothetical protein [Hymenobacter jeongseonensis]MBF9237872.1 hypothetical protein [Hymenobacter jeongseonensis]